MSKQITLLTYGTRGDVEPFLALGFGLHKAGFSVRLVAPAPFAPQAFNYGIEFIPIAGDPDQMARALANRAGFNPARMVSEMSRHVFPIAVDVFRTVQAASKGADLIVHSFLMTDAGHTLAVQQGIPEISAQLFPIFQPTSVFAALAMPDLPLGSGYRRFTHQFSTAVFRYGSRLMYQMLRRSTPDLPDLAPWIFQSPLRSEMKVLYAYSSLVLPRPDDWPLYTHVTGYWRLPIPGGWSPPSDLVNFIKSGSPPIYFGPGSMRSKRLSGLLRSVIAAARACGQRILLGIHPDEFDPSLAGSDVYLVDDIPHSWLFPRMGLILHHGGAGTTASAAISGVPNAAIPFSADQAFWAGQIQRLGLGPSVPPATHLRQPELESVIRDGMQNPQYRYHAQVMAGALRAEDGVANAERIIQGMLGSKSQR